MCVKFFDITCENKHKIDFFDFNIKLHQKMNDFKLLFYQDMFHHLYLYEIHHQNFGISIQKIELVNFRLSVRLSVCLSVNTISQKRKEIANVYTKTVKSVRRRFYYPRILNSNLF